MSGPWGGGSQSRPHTTSGEKNDVGQAEGGACEEEMSGVVEESEPPLGVVLADHDRARDLG
jgi:hypothetical protein